MRDVCIVSMLASEEGCSAWTAIGSGCIMIDELRAFGKDLFMKDRLVVCRTEHSILVITQDENDIWLIPVSRLTGESQALGQEDGGPE